MLHPSNREGNYRANCHAMPQTTPIPPAVTSIHSQKRVTGSSVIKSPACQQLSRSQQRRAAAGLLPFTGLCSPHEPRGSCTGKSPCAGGMCPPRLLPGAERAQLCPTTTQSFPGAASPQKNRLSPRGEHRQPPEAPLCVLPAHCDHQVQN